MTEQHDRDELVELMSRYANMPDTQNWDELPRSVFCDEFTVDFSSLGAPVTTFSRDAWCQQMKQVFAGWTATHHAITNHRIAIDGDQATIRASYPRSTGLPPRSWPADRSCWLVVGFYDDVAVRTPEGWRLSSVKLTLTYQENEALLAASIGGEATDVPPAVRRNWNLLQFRPETGSVSPGRAAEGASSMEFGIFNSLYVPHQVTDAGPDPQAVSTSG